MTLWILFCRMTKDVDTLLTFYARDRHHVELKAEEILDWYGYERLDLKEYRGGCSRVCKRYDILLDFSAFMGNSDSDIIDSEK
jgi:hypothetical protein